MRCIAFGIALVSLFTALGCEPLAEPPGSNSPTITTPDATPETSPVPTTSTDPTTTTLPDAGTAPSSDAVPSSLPPTAVDTNPAPPDNTAKNERDADGDTKTPLDQGSSERDTEITAEIRQAVLDMDDASVNARNAKIVTVDGKVTLRGPVEDAQERDAIEQIAIKAAGAGNVDNQLEVKTE